MSEVAPHRRDAPRDGRGREPVRAHRRHPALEILDAGVRDRLPGMRRERREVAAIRVDGAGRAPCCEVEQEALDVVVGGGHGAGTDSAAAGRLLSDSLQKQAKLPRLLGRATVSLAGVLLLLGALPDAARASQLLARNSSSETLAVGISMCLVC